MLGVLRQVISITLGQELLPHQWAEEEKLKTDTEGNPSNKMRIIKQVTTVVAWWMERKPSGQFWELVENQPQRHRPSHVLREVGVLKSILSVTGWRSGAPRAIHSPTLPGSFKWGKWLSQPENTLRQRVAEACGWHLACRHYRCKASGGTCEREWSIMPKSCQLPISSTTFTNPHAKDSIL